MTASQATSEQKLSPIDPYAFGLKLIQVVRREAQLGNEDAMRFLDEAFTKAGSP